MKELPLMFSQLEEFALVDDTVKLGIDYRSDMGKEKQEYLIAPGDKQKRRQRTLSKVDIAPKEGITLID
jgi:hypothetical protein